METVWSDDKAKNHCHQTYIRLAPTNFQQRNLRIRMMMKAVKFCLIKGHVMNKKALIGVIWDNLDNIKYKQLLQLIGFQHPTKWGIKNSKLNPMAYLHDWLKHALAPNPLPGIFKHHSKCYQKATHQDSDSHVPKLTPPRLPFSTRTAPISSQQINPTLIQWSP